MPRGRSTITRDTVIRRPSATPTPEQGIKDEEKKATQTAVWLNEDETNWIDDRVTEIKRGGWKGITRSAFIRAAIQALMEKKDLDIKGVSGEAELKQRIAQKKEDL